MLPTLGITDEVLRRGFPYQYLDDVFVTTIQFSVRERIVDISDSMKSYIGGLGVSISGKSCRVVSCVRACAWSGCLVELDLKNPCRHVPFSLWGDGGVPSFPFSLLGATRFPLSLSPHPPNLLSNFNWVYRYEEPQCEEYDKTF